MITGAHFVVDMTMQLHLALRSPQYNIPSQLRSSWDSRKFFS